MSNSTCMFVFSQNFRYLGLTISHEFVYFLFANSPPSLTSLRSFFTTMKLKSRAYGLATSTNTREGSICLKRLESASSFVNKVLHQKERIGSRQRKFFSFREDSCFRKVCVEETKQKVTKFVFP